MDKNGDAIVAWQEAYSSVAQSFKANFSAASDKFDPNNVQTIAQTKSGESQDLSNLQLALDDDGYPYVAWFQQDKGSDGAFRKAPHILLPAMKGQFGVSYRLTNPSSDEQVGDSITLAVKNSGLKKAVVAWTSYLNFNKQIRGSQLTPQESNFWSVDSLDILPSAGMDLKNVKAAMGPDGRAIVGWETRPPQGMKPVINTKVQNSNSSFPNNEQQLAIPGESSTQWDLAINQSGDAFATWVSGSSSLSYIAGAVKYASADTFSTARRGDRVDATVQPQASVGQGGDASAAWANATQTIGAAGFVGSAPESVSVVTPPSKAQAGETVNFAAQAKSVWPVTVGWQYGDGSSGNGENSAHYYHSGGSFDVVASATDELDNKVSSSPAHLTVASAPTVRLLKQPTNDTQERTATFQFTSDDALISPVSYRCSIDGGTPQGCDGSFSRESLGAGEHTFKVQASIGNGIYGKPTEYRWTIKGTPDNGGASGSSSTPGPGDTSHLAGHKTSEIVLKDGTAGLFGKVIRLDRKGKGKLKVACERKTKGCKGTIALKAKVKRGKKTRTVNVATLRYSIASGGVQTIKFKASKAARKALSKVRSAKGQATISQTGSTAVKAITSNVKFKLAKAKKH
jgi:hypothetical protein